MPWLLLFLSRPEGQGVSSQVPLRPEPMVNFAQCSLPSVLIERSGFRLLGKVVDPILMPNLEGSCKPDIVEINAQGCFWRAKLIEKFGWRRENSGSRLPGHCRLPDVVFSCSQGLSIRASRLLLLSSRIKLLTNPRKGKFRAYSLLSKLNEQRRA